MTKQKTVSEAIKYRRSVRIFDSEKKNGFENCKKMHRTSLLSPQQ